MAALPTPAAKAKAPADREAGTDAAWFDEHPSRRYRLRPGWAVRRVAGVYLRTPIASRAPDDEREAEKAWWAAAWPALDEKTRGKLMRKARKRAR
jgi:hypothetical protein